MKPTPSPAGKAREPIVELANEVIEVIMRTTGPLCRNSPDLCIGLSTSCPECAEREKILEKWDGAQVALSSRSPAPSEIELAKLIGINYCSDLAEEGTPWEVPMEPEPDYYATFRDALTALVEMLHGAIDDLTAAGQKQPEGEVVEANLSDYAKRYFRLFEQYRTAWLREMGGVIRPKHWEIDGFVLRMRDIYEKAQLVDRMKQIMVKKLEEKCTAEQLFDAVFEMLAKDRHDQIPTN